MVSEVTHALQHASVCIVAQGAKSIGIGDSIHEYGAAQVAVFSIDVPVAAQITRATPAEPYLVLRIARFFGTAPMKDIQRLREQGP